MKKRWLIAVIAAYIIARIYTATLSSYGFYHGWNEGWYSLIAKNYFSGSLWEQIAYTGGSPFSSAPPFFSYAVFAFFKIFGIADISARLVSILSEIIAVVGVYILAMELYNEKTADMAAIIFIFIPWNILWFGRVQTDPLMTALMTLAIALYVQAYRNNKSMLPFGITLGLAVFTKQPALAALLIVLIWSYFEGIKKEPVQKALIYIIIGLVPLLTWLSYYILIGNTSFVTHFIYGELTNRSSPFSDLFKVVAATLVGISPLVLLFVSYEMIKFREIRRNPLIPWLLIFGIFVLVRTPPSHEYYSLPLTPPVAILTAAGIIRLSDNLKNWRILNIRTITAIVILSTLPVTYALLSYSGDTGYTCTEDAGNYLNEYMEQHPEDTFLIITPGRYIPQMIWYANLTTVGYSNREVYGISNELSSVSTAYIENIITSSNATNIFLAIDDREGLSERISHEYEIVYSSEYETVMPDIAGVYTQEGHKSGKFGQKIMVYRLK